MGSLLPRILHALCQPSAWSAEVRNRATLAVEADVQVLRFFTHGLATSRAGGALTCAGSHSQPERTAC